MPTQSNNQAQRKLKTARFLLHVGRLRIQHHTTPRTTKTVNKQKLPEFSPQDCNVFI